MAWDTLPITTSFDCRTAWNKAGYFRITPVQVLQRNLHFTILSVADAEGVTIKLKIARSLLPLFHTAQSSMIRFWYEGGNLRFGCQRPEQAFPEDEFLTKDQPNVPRSTWDPTYKPMMEGFEPWAQHFESSELSAGYGLVSEADEFHEPWMEGRFGLCDSFDSIPFHRNEVQPLQPQGQTRSPVFGNSAGPIFEHEDYPEPWMYSHIILASNHGEDWGQPSDEDYPEWFRPSSTLSSTSAGNIYQICSPDIQAGRSSTSHRNQMSDDTPQYQGCQCGFYRLFTWATSRLSQVFQSTHVQMSDKRAQDNTRRAQLSLLGSYALSTSQTCFSGLHHMTCQGLHEPYSNFASQSRNSQSTLNSCQGSVPIKSMAPTDDFIRHDGPDDFVKQFWERDIEDLKTSSPFYCDMFDLYQFCRVHRISCTKRGYGKPRSTDDRSPMDRRTNHSFDVSHLFHKSTVRPKARYPDIDQPTDDNLGCVPVVSPCPERPKEKPFRGTRDALIPPRVRLLQTSISSPNQSICLPDQSGSTSQQNMSFIDNEHRIPSARRLIPQTFIRPTSAPEEPSSLSSWINLVSDHYCAFDNWESPRPRSYFDDTFRAIRQNYIHQHDDDICTDSCDLASCDQILDSSPELVLGQAFNSQSQFHTCLKPYACRTADTDILPSLQIDSYFHATQCGIRPSDKVLIYNFRAHRARMASLTQNTICKQRPLYVTTSSGAVPDYHPHITNYSTLLVSLTRQAPLYRPNDSALAHDVLDPDLLQPPQRDTIYRGAVPVSNNIVQAGSTVFDEQDTRLIRSASLWPSNTVPTSSAESRSYIQFPSNIEDILPVVDQEIMIQSPHHFTTSSGTVPINNHGEIHIYDQPILDDISSYFSHRDPLLRNVSFTSVRDKTVTEWDALPSTRLQEVYISTPLKGVCRQLLQPDHRNIDEFVTMDHSSRLSLSNSTTQLWSKPFESNTHSDLATDFSRTTASRDHTWGNFEFRGWSQAVYTGGHPAWGRCQIIHMAPNPPFAERCAAALQDNGWLASDEALWFLRKLKDWRTDINICPIIQWSPSRDLRHLMAAEDQLQFTNHRLNILLFLVEAHWCAVEVDRRTDPVHVVLIQWPSEHHTTAVLELSRTLQIPPHHMLVTFDSNHEVLTMCGWTILFRWYHNFAMQTCLQPMIHVTNQHQAQFDRVILRSQQHWHRTNATPDLLRFAVECRSAFMSEYASNQPDSRLPRGVDTVMFVGPQEEYVQEICQVPRPPTNREREINYLRTMLIQPAWMTNFEVELVLRTVRMQVLDRYLPCPLHFDTAKESFESLSGDLPSVAGYTKVLFFITFNYHWISISGLKHQHRWMLTAAVPAPEDPHLAPLFRAVAALLETSPDRIHVQATATQSHQHLCGWILLHSLQEHCEVSLTHDTTTLLQRIAVMPNSRIKNLLFEEALSTWTRHAPNQDVVVFATQVRTFFLAHMDMWDSQATIHFGGMFPQPAMTPARASWNTVSLPTKAKLLQKIRGHVQRPYVCPCIQRVTAYIIIDRLLDSDANCALYGAFIKPSPLKWATHFCGERVSHAICTHDQITEVVIQVPKRYAELIPLHVEAIVYQGQVHFQSSQAIISIMDLESGIRVFRTGRNHPTTNFDMGEFCSGAFSGWTQATKILETMGYTTATKFAIDHDHCVATWYSRNYTADAMAAKPEDVFQLRDECFYYRELPITFQTDLALGWYLIFCEPIEIATASPPCPAFSSASTAAGLEKAEGQVIIDTLLKVMLLQPKVLVLEEVANLRTHAHFPLVLELLNWGNFQVAWQEVLNLEEWLPQSRPRLILIAIRRCAYGLKHFACQPWPSNPLGPTSLRNCHCLLRDTATIELMSAPLDCDIAKLYLDPSKVPGTAPRTFQDAVRFRLRTEQDRVQCLMTSYAFGHEFDATSATPKGIFGNLIRHNGCIRFLVGPELLWLQGLSVPWKGPIHPRLLNHIVGNAISIPHALLGLLNALCHFSHLELDTFPHELFRVAMQSRLHAVNSDCLVDPNTGTFSVAPKEVPATLPWDAWEDSQPPLTQVDLLQGNRQRSICVQPGLPILPIFRSLFKSHTIEHIYWLPFNQVGVALPLVDTDTFCGGRMTFSLPDSYRLCIQETSFQEMATEWTTIFLPDRLVICQVSASTTISDLTSFVSHERSMPYQLCNHTLKSWNSTARPPQAIIARCVEAFVPYVEQHFQGTFVDMGDWLQVHLPISQATEFLQNCHGSGLTDLLWAFGWRIFCLQEPNSVSMNRSIMILPACAQLFVDSVAVRNILAAHITTWYIPPSSNPTTNTVHLSLKLWATVIWEGHLPITTKTDIFASAWHAASAFLGPQVQVRSILRGKRLSPEESFAGYIAQEDKDSPLNRVHLIGVLSGGGSKTDLALRTNQAMTDFLLQSGASSIQTPQFVKDVLTLAGVTRIQQILAMSDSEMKLEQIKQTALYYHIPLPDFADFQADTTKRIRKFVARRFQQTNVHKAADFRLSDHLFHDTNGEPIPHGTDSTKSQGVFLIDAQEALEFQQTHQSASLPCIMVVLGPTCPLESKSCHPCNLPATDAQDAKVVIAACVHMLGTAKAVLRGADQDDINTEPTSVVAFTAWRSELADSLWDQLCDGPLKTIWKTFSIDPTRNVVNKPWGRSWRNNNQAVEPEQAESFQVHVRLYTSKISAVLAQSGSQGIFVNPKTADGNLIDTSYAVVWLRDHDHTQALEAAKKIPEHAGLVVSFRGKKGYGLRVPSSVYEEAQNLLTPSLPKQTHIPANCFVKLSPLPHGVTADDIRTWIEKQALRMRPVRSLAPNTWLLAASDKIEACHYLWGKSTVLIAPVTSTVPAKPTIVAGGMKAQPVKPSLPPIQFASDSSTPDTWDPWAQWNPSLGDATSRTQSTSNSDPSRVWSSKTSQSSRSSNHTSASQASDIAAIQIQIRDLTKATKASQDNETKIRQDMQNEFTRVRAEMRMQIETSETSMRATLDQRIHCLEKSLQETNIGMKEGFSAILAKLGQTCPDDTAKRAKSDGAMQVEPPS